MDVSKEIVEKTFEAIELAKKSGKIKKGANEVTKIVERGLAKLVVIAKDVSPPEITMHFPALCKEKNTPLITVPSKEELGTVAGIAKPTTAVAIIQEGEAREILKDIVQSIKHETATEKTRSK